MGGRLPFATPQLVEGGGGFGPFQHSADIPDRIAIQPAGPRPLDALDQGRHVAELAVEQPPGYRQAEFFIVGERELALAKKDILWFRACEPSLVAAVHPQEDGVDPLAQKEFQSGRGKDDVAHQHQLAQAIGKDSAAGAFIALYHQVAAFTDDARSLGHNVCGHWVLLVRHYGRRQGDMQQPQRCDGGWGRKSGRGYTAFYYTLTTSSE